MLRRIFLKKTNSTYVQGFRYLFAGAAGFTTDFTILYILTSKFHIHYLLSATIGFIAGVFITYIISIYWVFQQKSHRSRAMEFALFVVIGVVGLVLTLCLLWLFTEKLHIYYLVSKMLATVLVYFWNFFARKKLLFNPVETTKNKAID